MFQKNTIDFSDFFSHTAEEWKNSILKELKNNSLEILSKNSEGLDIKGFYTNIDTKDLSYLESFHRLWLTKSPRQWHTNQYLPLDENIDFEALMMSAQKGGIDGYYFDIKKSSKSTKEILRLLRNVDKSQFWILARTESSFYELFECLKDVDNSHLSGLLAQKTNFLSPQNIMDNLQEYKNGFILSKNSSNLKYLGIDSSELNTSAPFQVAASIAMAIEIVDFLTKNGQKIEDILPHIGFSIAIRDNYFIEIAKLRALRLMWAMIVKEYGINFDAFSTPIHCVTIGGAIDANTNLLHHTTQAMAAIIGGCDALTILPSDIGKEMNEFSSRMARNISLLLKEEAHLDYTVDPSGGSYMIESLTHQVAQVALAKLKDIESHNGLINYLNGGNTL